MNYPKVSQNFCKSCEYCVNFCPKKCITIGETRNRHGHFFPIIDLEACIGCGTCALVCPEAAIGLYKKAEEG